MILMRAFRLYNRPLHGFRRHLGCGAVAAKITANVWEILQLSTLVKCNFTITRSILTKNVSLKGNDMEIISSKQEEFKATTFVVNILKLHTGPYKSESFDSRVCMEFRNFDSERFRHNIFFLL